MLGYFQVDSKGTWPDIYISNILRKNPKELLGQPNKKNSLAKFLAIWVLWVTRDLRGCTLEGHRLYTTSKAERENERRRDGRGNTPALGDGVRQACEVAEYRGSGVSGCGWGRVGGTRVKAGERQPWKELRAVIRSLVTFCGILSRVV